MISLEAFTPADFGRLINWVDSQALLTQFAGPIFRYPLSEEQLDTYLAEPQRRAFRVFHQQRVIGHAEIMLSEDGVAKLCRLLIGRPQDRGQGWGEQLVRTLLHLCWKRYGVNAVELNVYDGNPAAIRCYEKVGFIRQSEQELIAAGAFPSKRIINMRINKGREQ